MNTETCGTCGRTFSQAEYLTELPKPERGISRRVELEDDGSETIYEFRACPCGNTLMRQVGRRQPRAPQAFAAFVRRRRPTGGSAWVSAGAAQAKPDGTIDVELDALPIDGRIRLHAQNEDRGVVYAVNAPALHGPGDELAIILQRAGKTRILKRIATGAKGLDRVGVALNLATNAAQDEGAELAASWLRSSTTPTPEET